MATEANIKEMVLVHPCFCAGDTFHYEIVDLPSNDPMNDSYRAMEVRDKDNNHIAFVDAGELTNALRSVGLF